MAGLKTARGFRRKMIGDASFHRDRGVYSEHMTLRPFHLAFVVNNLDQARSFWGGIIGCPEGRSSENWIDFDFYGHQIVAHIAASAVAPEANNTVDCQNVPVPHFGIVLAMDEWERLAERLRRAGVQFVIEPHVRFRGQPGEQATMFFCDPAGNAIEMKAFADLARLFATD